MKAVPSLLRASARQGALRNYSTKWKYQAASQEHWSYLPVLNVVKSTGVIHEVPSSATIYRAIVRMTRDRSGSVLVKEDGALAGIVTERDILTKVPMGVGKSRSMPVTSIMTKSDSLVKATPAFTLDKCIKTSKHTTCCVVSLTRVSHDMYVAHVAARSVLTSLSCSPVPPCLEQCNQAVSVTCRSSTMERSRPSSRCVTSPSRSRRPSPRLPSTSHLSSRN